MRVPRRGLSARRDAFALHLRLSLSRHSTRSMHFRLTRHSLAPIAAAEKSPVATRGLTHVHVRRLPNLFSKCSGRLWNCERRAADRRNGMNELIDGDRSGDQRTVLRAVFGNTPTRQIAPSEASLKKSAFPPLPRNCSKHASCFSNWIKGDCKTIQSLRL
jgi:hypothetical protein